MKRLKDYFNVSILEVLLVLAIIAILIVVSYVCWVYIPSENILNATPQP